MTLLCQAACGRGWSRRQGVGFECAVDDVGQVAIESAEYGFAGFAGGLCAAIQERPRATLPPHVNGPSQPLLSVPPPPPHPFVGGHFRNSSI